MRDLDTQTFDFGNAIQSDMNVSFSIHFRPCGVLSSRPKQPKCLVYPVTLIDAVWQEGSRCKRVVQM